MPVLGTARLRAPGARSRTWRQLVRRRGGSGRRRRRLAVESRPRLLHAAAVELGAAREQREGVHFWTARAPAGARGLRWCRAICGGARERVFEVAVNRLWRHGGAARFGGRQAPPARPHAAAMPRRRWGRAGPGWQAALRRMVGAPWRLGQSGVWAPPRPAPSRPGQAGVAGVRARAKGTQSAAEAEGRAQTGGRRGCRPADDGLRRRALGRASGSGGWPYPRAPRGRRGQAWRPRRPSRPACTPSHLRPRGSPGTTVLPRRRAAAAGPAAGRGRPGGAAQECSRGGPPPRGATSGAASVASGGAAQQARAARAPGPAALRPAGRPHPPLRRCVCRAQAHSGSRLGSSLPRRRNRSATLTRTARCAASIAFCGPL
jgi:hypothetical protein